MLAMEILGGAEGEDAKAFTWRLPSPRKTKLNKYRLGYVIDDVMCRVSSEIKAPLAKMVKALKEECVEVVEGWPSGVNPMRLFEDYRYIRYASSAASHSSAQISELLKAENVSDGSDEYAAVHAYASSVKEFQDALWRRVQAQEAWREYFRNIDAFLIPPSFVPAFPHDHRSPLKSRVLQTPKDRGVHRPALLDQFRHSLWTTRYSHPCGIDSLAVYLSASKYLVLSLRMPLQSMSRGK